MFLLKKLSYDHGSNQVEVVDGIRSFVSENGVIVQDEFWGRTEVNLGLFADKSKFEDLEDGLVLINYANECSSSDIGDNYKKLTINVSVFEQEKIEGYIVFIKHSVGGFKTNGEILFKRYYTECVAILREGEYLKYDGGIVKVIDAKLVHTN